MNIKFAGGEPLLRFGLLQQLVAYVDQMRGQVAVTYTLLTNGVLITPHIAEYLRSHSVGVGVSLDGVGPINDTCRQDRRGRGSSDGVLKGLETLRRSGIVPTIMTTVSSWNYPHLEELTRFLLAGRYRFRYSLEREGVSGRPKLLDHLAGLEESLHRCYDFIEAHLPAEDFTRLHTFGDVSFRRPARRSCGAGNSFYAVGHDGSVGVCGLGLSKPFSTLGSDGDLLTLVRQANPGLSAGSASEYLGCRDCVWRKSCAGGCTLQAWATYGRFDAASPYCEVYRQMLPRVLRIKGLQMIRAAEAL
jgi:uncharacterized protein